jgi:hypothetical protein
MTTGTDHSGAGDARAVTTPSIPRRSRHDPTTRRIRLRLADLLLPVGIGLWALGVSTTDATALGPYGLPPVLPTAFWAGVALIVVSAAVELGRDHPSGWRMSLHAVTLAIMLYGTAPLVYSQGRYSWLYKTIGVVQYVNAHGQLNHNIDIYQNWPGFFALAAWFGKVAGVASPLAYAKWAQLAFELAALPLLYVAYDALSLTIRQRWLALLLYTGTNWIGQDYFSPQALGTLLSLGVMAIALRWFYLRKSLLPPASEPDRACPGQTSSRAGYPVLLFAALLLIYFVLTFEHELSPYILAVQLGALAVARLLRPRWLPVLLAAIAVGYLLPRFSYVNSTYGLLNSIGNFFSNATPPAFQRGSVPAAQRLIEHSQEALSLGMWCLALAGAWLRRRSGRTVLALVLLAFSPFIMLVLLAYGQEGILRVYLFSLPWTAALAALALAPFPAVRSELSTYSTPKPAQALATALWVPKTGVRRVEDTAIFHQGDSHGLTHEAVPARRDADIARGQVASGQAGTSGTPLSDSRLPIAPPSWQSGSSDAEDTMIFSSPDADGQAAALADPDADIARGHAASGQAGTSGAPSSGSVLPAGQRSGWNLATIARRNPRTVRLARREWQVIIWLVLAALVFVASIIAAVLLRG